MIPAFQLFILNRKEAEAFTTATPYAIVAVTDPDEADPSYITSSFCRRILNLKVNDLRHPCCAKHRLFDDEHARQIVEFAHWFRDSGFTQLVVHCEAGVSRSSAIALAIARFLGQEIDDVLNPFQRYRPNTFIYWRIVRALMPGRELELLGELFEWTARGAAVVVSAKDVECSEVLQTTVK